MKYGYEPRNWVSGMVSGPYGNILGIARSGFLCILSMRCV
jgi:hypothetical protein